MYYYIAAVEWSLHITAKEGVLSNNYYGKVVPLSQTERLIIIYAISQLNGAEQYRKLCGSFIVRFNG